MYVSAMRDVLENGASIDQSIRYSTLDNIDGKQARRTGTSSPLGELFELVATILDDTWIFKLTRPINTATGSIH